MSVHYYDATNDTLVPIAGGQNYSNCPIGTILSYGGTAAPAGYLLCQGQEVSKTTYSQLYAVIGDKFGTASGSGNFKLPDLRGEFLRGAGTNSHADQGNGGTVGQHQDATEMPHIFAANGQGLYVYKDIPASSPNWADVKNVDKTIGTVQSQLAITGTNDTFTDTGFSYSSVRPTNTSVNFIIKALNISNSPDEVVDYSTDEVFTGKHWIDGKPIYRKVFQTTGINNAIKEVATIDNLSSVTSISGVENNSTNSWGSLPYVHDTTKDYDLGIDIYQRTVRLLSRNVDTSAWNIYIIVEYTKTT